MRILPGGVGLAIALMGAADGLTPEAFPSAASAARPMCCYTNPQYAGVCVVQPAQNESCASVRTYLNNPQSQGKAYCGSTSIRGGWRQVKCPRPVSGAARPSERGTADSP